MQLGASRLQKTKINPAFCAETLVPQKGSTHAEPPASCEEPRVAHIANAEELSLTVPLEIGVQRICSPYTRLLIGSNSDMTR